MIQPSLTFQFPRLVVNLFLLLGTVLAGIGLSRLGFEDRHVQAFGSSDVRFKLLRNVSEAFGIGDHDVIALVEGVDVLSAESLAAIRRFHAGCQEIAVVEEVTSLHSVRRVNGVRGFHLPLFPKDGAVPESFQQARAAAAKHPLLTGRLLSADGRSALVFVRLEDGLDRPQTAQALDAIETCARAAITDTDLTVRLTGVPAVRVETIHLLLRDLVWITGLGWLLALSMAMWLLGNWRAVVLAILPPFLGVMWTLGAVGLCGQNLDPLSMVLPTLMLIVGVSDSMHLVADFRSPRFRSLPAGTAASQVVHEVGQACLLTMVTTLIAFGTLAFSPDRLIHRFGVFAALGVVLTFLAVIGTFWLLAGTRFGEKLRCGEPASNEEAAHGSLLNRGILGLMEHLLNFRRPIIAGAVLFLGLTLPAWPLLRPDYHLLENLGSTSESVIAARRLDTQFGGQPLLQIVVEWPTEEDAAAPHTLRVLEEVHMALQTTPVAQAPVSLLTLLESVGGDPKNLANDTDKLRWVSDSIQAKFIHPDLRWTLVTAFIPDAGAARLKAPLESLEQKLAAIEQRHAGFRVHLTGLPVATTFRTSAMIGGLVEGLFWEAVLIFVAIGVTFRSLRFGLLSVLPNLCPLLGTGAALVAGGWQLEYATVIAFNICLGLAVDDTIHTLRLFRSHHVAGLSRIDAVRRTYRTLGPTMMTTAMLFLCGFGTCLLSSTPTVRAFGAIACIVVLLSQVSELLLMPALLASFGGPNGRLQTEHHAGFWRMSPPWPSLHGSDGIMKATFLAGLAAALVHAAWQVQTGRTSADWVFWLIWPAMALHQAEENVFSEWVLGERFRFLNWVRQVGFSISPLRCGLLNFGVGWSLGLTAGAVGQTCVAIPLFVLFVETINGGWHLTQTLFGKSWSPGTLSSVFVTIPLGLSVTAWSVGSGLASPLTVIVIFAAAFLSHEMFLRSLPRVTAESMAVESHNMTSSS